MSDCQSKIRYLVDIIIKNCDKQDEKINKKVLNKEVVVREVIESSYYYLIL